MYGLYNLSESNVVNSISRIDSGPDAGKLKITVNVTPLITKDIIAHPSDVYEDGRIGTHGYSALKIAKGHCVSTRTDFKEEKVLSIETADNGNAWIDHEGMDWLLEKKPSDSQTESLYADLIHSRAKKFASTKREKKDLLHELKYIIEK